LLELAAGYYGGRTDRIVGRTVDTIMAFPLFVLAMGIVAALSTASSRRQYRLCDRDHQPADLCPCGLAPGGTIAARCTTATASTRR